MSGQTRTIDDRQLDRLGDGQLSQSQQRELLAQLDAEPGGWRRCALAFLEAQAWRDDLGAVVRSASVQPPAPPAVVARTRRSASRWPSVLAVAATLAIAFGLGMLVRPAWRGAEPGLEQVARQEGLPGRAQDASPWRMVTLTSPDASEPIRLPAVERNRIDDAWLRSLPAAVPPDVLRALQRSGYAVRQSQQLMPVPLEDGRRLVVPVDQVEVRPVGRYQ